jgi:hypothetical protein
MRSANATKLHGKSGERSRGICSSADLSWECFVSGRVIGGCEAFVRKSEGVCKPFDVERYLCQISG